MVLCGPDGSRDEIHGDQEVSEKNLIWNRKHRISSMTAALRGAFRGQNLLSR